MHMKHKPCSSSPERTFNPADPVFEIICAVATLNRQMTKLRFANQMLCFADRDQLFEAADLNITLDGLNGILSEVFNAFDDLQSVVGYTIHSEREV